MGKLDRLIVPGTVVAAMLAMFLVTNSWIRRPTDGLLWKMTWGPPTITAPHHEYGLRFTSRNILSGHALRNLVSLSSSTRCPAHQQCVDVTIIDTSLTYLDRRLAYRLPDGSYKLRYTFPRDDDYVIFVEMQPRGGSYQVARVPPIGALRVGRCHPPRRSGCASRRAALRGQELAHSQDVDGLTVVLGAPVHAVESGGPTEVSLVLLRGDRTALDIAPLDGTDGDAVAVSMDTYHFIRLHVDRQHSGKGVIAYAGTFDTPSIYRVWAPVPARHKARAQASFVVDVDPAPTPTPAGQ